MVRCPVCDAVQVVYLAAPLGTCCYYCGARWVQEDDRQRDVTPSGSSRPAPHETSPTVAPPESSRV